LGKCSKKNKKKLTWACASEKLDVHTVTVEQHNNAKMRTKTLLLTAAALLTAGIINLQAQPVYSQNVVGYSSQAAPNGANLLIDIPFNVGSSNGANEIWPGTTLPDFSQVLIWSSSTLSYTTYYSDSGSPSGWDDSGFGNLPGAPILPVGQGFFLIPSGNTTNTFSGSVAVNVGAIHTNHIVNGTTALVAPAVPYAGAVTNGSNTGGGVNLSANGGLPDFSQLLIWDPVGLSYTTYYSDSGSPSGWDDSGFGNLATPPTISVGQGFFIIPSGDFDWQVGLSP
jgi:hypothetical protein